MQAYGYGEKPAYRGKTKKADTEMRRQGICQVQLSEDKGRGYRSRGGYLGGHDLQAFSIEEVDIHRDTAGHVGEDNFAPAGGGEQGTGCPGSDTKYGEDLLQPDNQPSRRGEGAVPGHLRDR